jgi:hypothetical protein
VFTLTEQAADRIWQDNPHGVVRFCERGVACVWPPSLHGGPVLGRGGWPASGRYPRDRRGAGGPFEDREGQRSDQ